MLNSNIKHNFNLDTCLLTLLVGVLPLNMGTSRKERMGK